MRELGKSIAEQRGAIVRHCISYEFKDDMNFLKRKMQKRMREFKGCKKAKIKLMWSFGK